VLDVLISGIPRGSQLASASRFEQPHLARLRAAGDALEFGPGNLAFDEAGAQQIFSAAEVSLTPELVAAVTERTEGWPVGLYLAALIAKEGHAEAWTIAGDDRYVADYLYREILIRQPEDTQRFLRCTAVLDQFCAQLCDAVLASSAAAMQLRRLEASGLFLIPLDRRRRWYRYHALFREFLLGELRRIEPEHIATLHQRLGPGGTQLHVPQLPGRSRRCRRRRTTPSTRRRWESTTSTSPPRITSGRWATSR
jgi:LuxR family maltose regulon positive regulatory protein